MITRGQGALSCVLAQEHEDADGVPQS
jgi:hypothetical protein